MVHCAAREESQAVRLSPNFGLSVCQLYISFPLIDAIDENRVFGCVEGEI